MDWSKIRECRGRAYELMAPLMSAPRIGNGEELLIQHARPGSSLLDVGAHNRRIKHVLADAGSDINYRSLDVDRSLPHDYYSFSDIQEKFDLVAVLDVVEHLTPEAINELFLNSFAVMKPGGRIVVTTPNVSHPTRLWRDCTHITAMHHAELGGFLLAAGFDMPTLHRIRHMSFRDRILLPFAWPVIKLLEIDYAFGVAVTAARPA